MATPTSTRAWSLYKIDPNSFDGLELKESIPLPNLGDHDVLVQIEAVSLNYRDLALPRVGPMTRRAGTMLANFDAGPLPFCNEPACCSWL